MACRDSGLARRERCVGVGAGARGNRVADLLLPPERIVCTGGVCYNARRWCPEKPAAVPHHYLWLGRSPEYWSGVKDGT